jgi:hypothetical protein
MLLKFLCWLSQHGETLQPGLSFAEARWLRASVIAFAPLSPKAVVDVDRSSARTIRSQEAFGLSARLALHQSQETSHIPSA